MNFIEFKKALQENFAQMSKDASKMYEVSLDKDELWDFYQDSYPKGTNEIYRERREHECSCCRQFVKNIGHAVFIVNNEVHTIWDLNLQDATYDTVSKAMSNYVKSKTISDVWTSKFSKIGVEKNFEELEQGGVKEWEHFYLEVPKKFINQTNKSDAELQGEYRDTRNVFKRSLDEITEDSLLTVLELISQNSLYKGDEWKAVLTQFLAHKRAYDMLASDSEKSAYTWDKSVTVGGAIGRIRNHSIGTLLINISEGMDLDTAVKKYEVIVAPSNYKRPKAIFTKKMLEDAKKKIEELGYLESLGRRYATLDDITVNNILFTNKDSAKRIAGADIFAEMANEISTDLKKFSKVEEISIADFISNVLPNLKELEILLENRHASNLVSLIAPQNKDSKTMFKWDNNFSWAYAGNIADSLMKERVKSAGGNVDGVLRFSIQWNDEEPDSNDLDAHCTEPNGHEIYYVNKGRLSPTGGVLDVDIISPRAGTPAVENITWDSKDKMKKGTYKFFVHNFSSSMGKHGFKAELEVDGQIHTFEYRKPLRGNEKVEVVEVEFDGNSFKVVEKLSSTVSTKEIWNLKSNQFVPVSTVMFSPNYWDGQNGVGHKHYFFMLKDCLNTERPNSFFNEFLKEELMQHKRVFEALGSKMAVEDSSEQLSGIGFSSTKRNEMIVKAKSQTERTLKIKF